MLPILPRAADFSFAWPTMLWLLLAVPPLAWAYFRRVSRRRTAGRSPNLALLLGTARADHGRWHRYAPAAALLLGVCAFVVAVARPHAVVVLPSRMETVMLVIDTSGSMRAGDVKPSRIDAAREAAKTFVDDQPANVRVGVVATAGAAAVVQSPTRNREDIFQAIDRVQLQRGTALGSGLVIALAALLPEAGIAAERLIGGNLPRAQAPAAGTDPAKKAAAPGSYGSGAIVLVSDGQSNTGPDLLEISRLAADHGVRVYTVGIGTPEGATLSINGWSMRVRLDEETLKKVAAITHGEYFRADGAASLKKIYRDLSTRLALEKGQKTEVTALFAAFGAFASILGALLSLAWFNRIL